MIFDFNEKKFLMGTAILSAGQANEFKLLTKIIS